MAGSRRVPEARRLALVSNRERLAELYGEYRRYTVNYIARRVEPQHSHVVEDLAQDTFVKAWPSLHKVEVRDGSSYRRWLTRGGPESGARLLPSGSAECGRAPWC